MAKEQQTPDASFASRDSAERVMLPQDFITLMRSHLNEVDADALLDGLQQPPTIAVRFNPRKAAQLTLNREQLGDPVPWCPDAYYLSERKAFTFDPLFHAGVYYVQDASSMYLAEMLRKYLGDDGKQPIAALDLCAAPGGKSTLLAAHLPERSLLVSNEPIRKRASVLAENMLKWGYPNCYVTQNYPSDFSHLHDAFHLILTDVPCSGEGMFRKDATAIREWSLENVRQCVERQRDILTNIVPTLKPGGLLIYSTCTFNRYEDEDQVRWLMSEYGFQLLEERHFFPGRDRGEGLYMAALRKPGEAETVSLRSLKTLNVIAHTADCDSPLLPQPHFRGDESQNDVSMAESQLDLSYSQAISYLRREALHIPAPRGFVAVTYRGVPLGLAKSVGTRLNNLYPQEWRIRTTYNPTEPLPDFFC
ncbi:MAG: hypothetical protein K2H79_04575 [Bacteroidaceae bacterium]|nr:hypothetical protein [Bacteroidaceae bacterium]